MPKPPKTQYSELEAAQELGITVARLRQLIRSHIVDQEEELPDGGLAMLQPSDLLLLRILAQQSSPVEI